MLRHSVYNILKAHKSVCLALFLLISSIVCALAISVSNRHAATSQQDELVSIEVPTRLFHYIDSPKDWLECILPDAVRSIKYDPNLRYFSRAKSGKWFSHCKYLPKEKTLLWKDGKKHITVYFHGLGSFGNVAALEKYNLNVLPGCVASFDFLEASHMNLFDKVKYTNVGQKIDALIGLWILAQVNADCNPDIIHLHGVSRGGAVAIMVEAILVGSYQIPEQDLEQVGITPELRQELLVKIQRGARILDVPLCHGNRALKRRALGISSSLKTGIATAITRYNHAGPHPEEYAQTVNPLGRKSFIYFEKNDDLVGNMQDNAKLWTPWVEKNPETTSVLEGDNGDDLGHGGHVHMLYGGAELMAPALHAFMAKHNFPHDPSILYNSDQN